MKVLGMSVKDRLHVAKYMVISLVASIVVLDIIGSALLTSELAFYYRLGIGIGATVSLLTYVLLRGFK